MTSSQKTTTPKLCSGGPKKEAKKLREPTPRSLPASFERGQTKIVEKEMFPLKDHLRRPIQRDFGKAR
jgi:hypothetical protein